MSTKDAKPESSLLGGVRRWLNREGVTALWPQFPLAVVLALVGVLNFLDGLNLPLKELQRNRELDELAQSLSALGGTSQIILGSMLMLAGAGLLWRLVSAWTLSVLLLIITVGVNVAKENWGFSLALQAILLASLLWAKRYFVRRTFLASVVFSLSSVVAVLAYGVFGSYLLGKGFNPPIDNLSKAIYFTVVSLSTVGYGDVVPVSPEARWFVISLLVIGLGVFASAIASALGPKISGELNRLFNLDNRIMERKDHIILVGDGVIARNTATELKQRGADFVQIVADKARAVGVDHPIIEGDATSDAVLKQAGIQYARMVIAAREDDGENAFITLGSKDLNPKVRVMAVASCAQSIRRLKLAGADLVFSPAAVGSRLLADLVEGNEIRAEFRDLLEGRP